jgi:hypothetical protein
MAYPTPDTARVVTLVSELHMQARALFLADDGQIDAHEQPILDALDEIGYWAEEADDGRKAALGLLNCNEITDWHRRQWRERHRDRAPKDAA